MDKRELIKQFRQEGFTLRPECLNHLTEFFSSLPEEYSDAEKVMDRLLENIRVLGARNESVILEESIVKAAIDLFYRSTMEIEQNINSNMIDEEIVGGDINGSESPSQVKTIIAEKYLSSVVVLDTMKESGRVCVRGVKMSIEYPSFHNNGQLKWKQPGTLGLAEEKIQTYQRRFNLIRAKMSRSSKYVYSGKKEDHISEGWNAVNKQKNESDQNLSIEISDIGSLIGSQGLEKHVLGMTYEGLVGEYFLQDEVSRVKIDLSSAVVNKGYVTVSTVVIATGIYDQMKGEFKVSALNLPEYEEVTESEVGTKGEKIDTFGAEAKISRILGRIVALDIDRGQGQGGRSAKIAGRAAQVELGIFDISLNEGIQAEKEELCVAVFSDFFLSDASTLVKFEKILSVYEKQLEPIAFVLMGSFFEDSEVFSTNVHDGMRRAIADFLILLGKFPKLRDSCYWVLVPHIHDVGGAPIQPRISLPEDLFEDLKAGIPFLVLAQNPCRMSVFGKTFLISRNDLLRDLRKKQIVVNPDKDIQMNYVSTILSQRHLTPLPLLQRPVLWNYDHTLEFWEDPDFLILADSYSDQFEFAVHEQPTVHVQNDRQRRKTFVLNPGNFQKKSSFTLIYPIAGEVQSSSL